MSLYSVNIERGLPTVAQARIRLDQGLRDARGKRQSSIKIIHGYGSSGKGGAIKQDVHRQLEQLKAKGRIQDYLPGEQLTPFDPKAQSLLSRYPALRKDPDYSRDNAGITIVFL